MEVVWVCLLPIVAKTNNHDYDPFIAGIARLLLVHVQVHRLVRKNLKAMIALFITAIAVFIYMVYVLLKPEKF